MANPDKNTRVLRVKLQLRKSLSVSKWRNGISETLNRLLKKPDLARDQILGPSRSEILRPKKITRSAANAMKIAIVLPPKFIFDRDKPNSIETVVRTLNEHSSDNVIVICEEGAGAPEVMNVKKILRSNWNFIRARQISKIISDFRPDLIEVHQHAPSGKSIARRFKDIPSVLYRHNFAKDSENSLTKLRHQWRYGLFSSHIFVSRAARDQFVRAFPKFKHCSYVVPNSINFEDWYAPVEAREKTISFSGRAAPEKGIQHLVPALVQILEEHSDWEVCLCLGDWRAHEEWATHVIAPLLKFESRCHLRKDVPLDEVKKVFGAAKIAVVPSVWKEPFGLVAIEAHAAGAAVISSGTGGLREASGDSALYLDSVTSDEIHAKLERLIADETLRAELAARGQNFVRQNHNAKNRRNELRDVRQRIAGVGDDV